MQVPDVKFCGNFNEILSAEGGRKRANYQKKKPAHPLSLKKTSK